MGNLEGSQVDCWLHTLPIHPGRCCLPPAPSQSVQLDSYQQPCQQPLSLSSPLPANPSGTKPAHGTRVHRAQLGAWSLASGFRLRKQRPLLLRHPKQHFPAKQAGERPISAGMPLFHRSAAPDSSSHPRLPLCYPEWVSALPAHHRQRQLPGSPHGMRRRASCQLQ